MLDDLLEMLDQLWHSTCITFAQPWEIPFLVPAEERDEYENYLMERGEGVFSVGERRFPMQKGAVLFLRTDQENRFEPEAEDKEFRLLFVTFAVQGHCEAKARLDGALANAGALLLTPGDDAAVSVCLYELQRAMLLSPGHNAPEMRLLLGQLVLKLRDGYQNPRDAAEGSIPGRSAAGYVNKTVSYLQEHYAEEVTLQDLGKAVGLSPRYLSTLYSKRTGCSIWRTLVQIRLDHARRLLMTTDLSITRIAADTGFGTNPYFCRCFRKAEGVSPREYRKKKLNIVQ